MRRLTVVLASLILLASAAAWGHDEKLQAELLDEILRLTESQVANEVILEEIEAWGFVFELTADDIVELRSLGVNDVVLEALIATANTEENEVHARTRVVFSAGYYAPWYWYPVAWGGYYDPFPRLYCSYYYPFHYNVGYFGYYGWCGSTYYSHYYPQYWGREAWAAGRRVPNSPYTVASGLTSRRAGTMTVPTPGTGIRSRAATPRIIRGGTPESTALLRSAELRGVGERRGARPATAVGSRRSGFERSRANAVRQEVARRQGSGLRTLSPSRREARPATSPSRWQSARSGGMRSSAGSRGFSSPSSAPRFQAMPRGGSMSRMSSPPAAISGRIGAARGRGR